MSGKTKAPAKIWGGIALSQLVAGALVLGVGTYLDVLDKTPGVLTLGGMLLLGGPALALALRSLLGVREEGGEK